MKAEALFLYRVNPADSEFLPMDVLLEEDNEANVYNSDSIKQYSGRYRPSFLMSILNPNNFVQSIRKRSMQKAESFREGQGHVNPSFTMSSENYAPPRGNTPTSSRSSSIAKRQSPSHSRSSSISFHPNTLNKHRHKSYDVQQAESNLANGGIPEGEGANIKIAISTAIAPVIANYEENSNNTGTTMESDLGHQKLKTHMSPIPEEPSSRVASMVNLDPNVTDSTQDVQTLVAEASKVLDELNRVVAAGKHKKECELKGYESCCSLGSNDSSEDEDDEADEISDADDQERSHSVKVEIPTVVSDEC